MTNTDSLEEEATFLARAKEYEEKAYAAARTGDMYQAYLDLDTSIKARAASCRQNVFDNPLFVQVSLKKHWGPLNNLANEAAERDPEARKRLEDSIIKLEQQREQNERDN